jgi:PAS domain S-box-containing protein
VLDTNDAARTLIRAAPDAGPFGAVSEHSVDLFVGAVRGFLGSRPRATWTGAHRDANGAAIGLQITSMISRVDDDWSVVLHTFEDQTERRAAEAESRRAGAILNGAAFAAERFLGATDWREEIDEVLRVVGEAAEVSRVYIFEHIQDDRGAVMRQIREWAAPGVTSQIDLPVYADLVVEGSDYESWLTTFNRGEPITALTRDLSPKLQEELASQAILSLIGVPIVAAERLWGHVGFDQCDHERRWTRAEQSALAMAARIIGAAIERSVSRETIRHGHDLMRTIVDSIPAMVNVKASDGRYVLMNHYQAALYGVAPDEAVGRTAADLLGDDYGAATHAFDRRVLDTGQPVEDYEQTYADAHGVIRTWVSTKLPLFDAQGRPNHVVTVAHDITERKQTEDRLREALAQAEAANRSKSEFIANISHELRTPLNAIIGFSEVMLAANREGGVDQQNTEYLKGILDSGRHLLEIVNDLLDIARLDAGKLSMAEGPVRLDRVVQSSLRLVRERALEAKLNLAWSPPTLIPSVWGDERRLRQVLLNLLTNAIKFTGAGGTVRVTLEMAEDGGVVMAVGDTGIGMSADEIVVALKPFGQIDHALSRNHGGVGLGLPLCKAMVEMHQGRLEIVSEPGQGTTIGVHLPPARTITANSGRHGAARAGDLVET